MKKIFLTFFTILIMTTFIACNNQDKTEVDNHTPQIDETDDNYRVFYEIFTGSFSDSNGDGIGDLRGIINRLDYLNDGDIYSGESLGIQGIWLTPIFASPTYHKYDVSDYYAIDSSFGTIDDLKELISECHKRNVLLILDLPINHTSSSHQWFTEFKRAHQNNDIDNQYYDYYTWCEIENKPAGRTFTKIPGTLQMYEANFTGDMPELNFENEKVREECLNIAKYYLDLGIDGFRFDAAKYIYYGDTNESVSFWNWYMAELRKIKSDVYCVGEVWSNDYETQSYTESLNCFNFQVAGAEGYLKDTSANGDVNIYSNYIVNYINTIHSKNNGAMIIQFISNHDMDRSAGYLTLASKRMNMAANLYILCSGSPFIYYGEEIGMKGIRGSAQTDANRRLAMLWGDGDTISDPEGTTYESSKQTNGTVLDQLNNEDSLLNYYKALIALRLKYPAIARGTYESLNLSGTKIGGFKITYEGKTIYLLHNTLDSDITISLAQITNSDINLLDYIGQGDSSIDGDNLIIGSQSSCILG